jgi:hypothetical protein
MVTGIELGPSTCVLVTTRRDHSVRAGGGPTIASARTFDARNRSALAAALGRALQDDGFAPRARVVAWGPPSSQIALDPAHLPDVTPLLQAGFEIEAILSPPQALARLLDSVQIDTQRTAVAAVALTSHGAALAIVDRGEVVAARTFEWKLGMPFSGTRSELLERYLVISQLAPQLQHLIELARPVYRAAVSSVVVCGSLPDLRSMSMLLIEELDLEVETLDATDRLAPEVAQQSESAASLQLAAAAAAGERSSERQSRLSAAAIRNLAGSIAFVLCAAWASLQVAGSAPAASAFPDGLAVAELTEAPPVSPMRPEATIGRNEVDPNPAAVPAPAAAPTLPLERSAGTERRTPAAREVVATSAPPAPLPRVDGIAISGDRRLAILDGSIVGPGDRIAGRTVKRIDTKGVLLGEPGGGEVFVAIRSRKRPDGL